MTDYKAMYLLLFNAVTDALEKMAKGFNMGGMNRNQMMAQARKMQEQLIAAQQKAEELYMDSDGE